MPVYLHDAPASEPVTVAEAKTHLRIEHTLDDAHLTLLISAARQWAEKHCWRGFVTQTWELVTNKFPTEGCNRPAFTRDNYDFEGFELPQGALASVTSVKYIDINGTEQTLVANTDYVVDTASVPGRVRLAVGKSWPDHQTRYDAVRIRYVVGTTVESVPTPIKQALLLLVSQLYTQREPEVTGASISQVKFAVEALLAPYRLVRHT